MSHRRGGPGRAADGSPRRRDARHAPPTLRAGDTPTRHAGHRPKYVQYAGPRRALPQPPPGDPEHAPKAAPSPRRSIRNVPSRPRLTLAPPTSPPTPGSPHTTGQSGTSVHGGHSPRGGSGRSIECGATDEAGRASPGNLPRSRPTAATPPHGAQDLSSAGSAGSPRGSYSPIRRDGHPPSLRLSPSPGRPPRPRGAHAPAASARVSAAWSAGRPVTRSRPPGRFEFDRSGGFPKTGSIPGDRSRAGVRVNASTRQRVRFGRKSV